MPFFLFRTGAHAFPVITVGEWSDRVVMERGDEWYVTLTGAAIGNPKIRIAIDYST